MEAAAAAAGERRSCSQVCASIARRDCVIARRWEGGLRERAHGVCSVHTANENLLLRRNGIRTERHVHASSARENYEQEAHQCSKCKFAGAVGAPRQLPIAERRRRKQTALRLCNAHIQTQLCFAFVSPFLKAVYYSPALPFSQREKIRNTV